RSRMGGSGAAILPEDNDHQDPACDEGTGPYRIAESFSQVVRRRKRSTPDEDKRSGHERRPGAAKVRHQDGRPAGDAVVKIDDILVQHSHAAGGYGFADGPPLRRSMD